MDWGCQGWYGHSLLDLTWGYAAAEISHYSVHALQVGLWECGRAGGYVRHPFGCVREWLLPTQARLTDSQVL